MTTKNTATGRAYEIEDGRYFVWHADVWEDQGETPFDVRIPLRFKVGVLRPLKDVSLDDPSAMLDVLELLIPHQSEEVDNLDVNDLQDMFTTWLEEYNMLSGATVGEASSSSS